jgi:hypothetical protein
MKTVGVTCRSNFRALYQRLPAKGKLKMVALVTVTRKMSHALYGMFKHQRVFDGAKVYALPALQIPTEEAA